MKSAFLDTSSLIKRYHTEEGSEKLDILLDTIFQVIVSPTYYLEVNATVSRLVRENVLTTADAETLLTEVSSDLRFFNVVVWNDSLEKQAVLLTQKYPLKTLDSLQLAFAINAKTDAFITSDRQLFTYAKKELNETIFV